MQFTRFYSILAPALLAATTLTASTLKAETLEVPFSFTVAGHDCPAGAYRVERNAQLGSGRVTLQSLSTSQVFSWELRPGDPAPNDTRIVLRFAQIGQEHALQSVQYRDRITSKIKVSASQAGSASSRETSGQ